mmetsp:Transcript_24275/g.33939  ORF Transcript_24275/g.33939 Transcript_24275/m.33939 type:complete len:166 (+) Transcript_24275:2-499(+)
MRRMNGALTLSLGFTAALLISIPFFFLRDSSDLAMSPRTSFRASSPTYIRAAMPSRGRVYARKEFHPEYHSDVPVFCNGEEVYRTSGTVDKYVVDIWSGNHPFYQGTGGMIVKADRIDKFKNKFSEMDDLFGDMSSASAADGVDLKKAAMESLGITKDKGKKKRR